jgi:hypothetical protein
MVWRALFGGAGSPLILLLRRLVVHFSKSCRRMFLRRILGPFLETGAVLDVALSKNARRIVIRCL